MTVIPVALSIFGIASLAVRRGKRAAALLEKARQAGYDDGYADASGITVVELGGGGNILAFDRSPGELTQQRKIRSAT